MPAVTEGIGFKVSFKSSHEFHLLEQSACQKNSYKSEVCQFVCKKVQFSTANAGSSELTILILS